MRLLSPRLGLLILFPLLAGCGVRTGHVTGKVTYNGNPVAAGWIFFRSSEPGSNPVSVQLSEDGSFEADVPAGEILVSVDNREWEPKTSGGSGGGDVPRIPPNIPISAEAKAKLAAAGGAKRPPAEPKPEPKPGRYVLIPEKYYDGATSGLKFTATGGAQSQNFELVD